ncbi:uncharacterized protein [Drosophila suzukii]|uniref:Uncharacterized protein n=1 Tax=Drosophila suzukii TaxID=28584 RepID=A0ABM4TQ19_DROSZ|nr:uncharacterized protein LOC108007324 isoform X2 [Drosophila suzukii]XP_036677459.1 uncharacterized protein LOC108007324 isoform X2 [Drosophila suzukii]XP_036677460.1 uncharacterized protein LOC108007324 isoform X2 [Drosophila suzukii]
MSIRKETVVGFQLESPHSASHDRASQRPAVFRFSAALATARSANSQSARLDTGSIAFCFTAQCTRPADSYGQAGYRAALIDPCTPSTFRLPTTSVGDERICSATIRSKVYEGTKLEVVLKIDPNVRIRTPIRPLPETIVDKI